MKTTINVEALKKALKSAKIYATEKSPWPTCKNVKMEALNGGIILTSTDKEKTAKAVIPCDVDEAGAVLLSPACVKTLEAVKSGALTIEATEKAVTISHGLHVVTLPADDPGDFPTEEKTERNPLFSCAGKDFEKLARVIPFTEKDNGRYSLGGVLIDFRDSCVFSVATDGRRMGVQKIDADKEKDGFFILFACDLKTLAKHLAKSEKITVYENAKDANLLTFADAGKEFSVRLLEGRFPDWKRGMGQLGTNAKKAVFPACELQKLTELKPFVSASDPGVFFRKLPGISALAVTNQNRNFETYLRTSVETWDTCKINLLFLLDIVKICGKEELNLEYIDHKNGYLFTCNDFQYLVMGMNGETATQATKRHEKAIAEKRDMIEKRRGQIAEKEQDLAKSKDKKLKESIAYYSADIERLESEIGKHEKEIERLAEAVKKEALEDEEDAKKAEALKKEWGESVKTEEKPKRKTAKKAPTRDANTPAATNTTPAEKAPETKAEETEQAKEETTEPEQEKRVKIAPTGSSAPLATVPEPEPMEAPTQAATETEPDPTTTEPEPMEPEPEPEQEKPFEIGTYTTKKGKIKTSIRFFQPPTPAQIDALKRAFYWEYNGRWCGSPRKLPEIFKR